MTKLSLTTTTTNTLVTVAAVLAWQSTVVQAQTDVYTFTLDSAVLPDPNHIHVVKTSLETPGFIDLSHLAFSTSHHIGHNSKNYDYSMIDIAVVPQPAQTSCAEDDTACWLLEAGLGDTREDGKTPYWCCLDEATCGRTLKRLMIDQARFKGNHRFVEINPEGHQSEAVPYGQMRLRDNDAGAHYYLVLANCNPHGRPVAVRGDVLVESAGTEAVASGLETLPNDHVVSLQYCPEGQKEPPTCCLRKDNIDASPDPVRMPIEVVSQHDQQSVTFRVSQAWLHADDRVVSVRTVLVPPGGKERVCKHASNPYYAPSLPKDYTAMCDPDTNTAYVLVFVLGDRAANDQDSNANANSAVECGPIGDDEQLAAYAFQIPCSARACEEDFDDEDILSTAYRPNDNQEPKKHSASNAMSLCLILGLLGLFWRTSRVSTDHGMMVHTRRSDAAYSTTVELTDSYCSSGPTNYQEPLLVDNNNSRW